MASCCDTLDQPKPAAGVKTVALAGNPNSGKTTIFNALTGLRQKVANYPGVTVEKKTGKCRLPGGGFINVIDLPGTYSLISRSPDERVAMEVLRGLRADTPSPDAVIVVVDASNLARNLYLVSQLIEMGKPLVVALNMMDVAKRRGLAISAERLQQQLGVPVIPVVGHKRQGIPELIAAVDKATIAPMPEWLLPEPMKEELTLVGGGLAILDEEESVVRGPLSVVKAATDSSIVTPSAANLRLDRYRAVAERLLIGDTASDLAEIAARQPVASLLASAHSRLTALGVEPMQADIEAHYHWIDAVAAGSLVPACERLTTADATLGYESKTRPASQDRTLTQKVDAILIHKVWGLLIFAIIMATLFVTIFWLAKPIMDGIQAAVTAVGGWSTQRMTDGPLKALLTDGIFAGVGAVVVFLPQIALLFLFLAILEDTGYLARAAFLMDRLLAKVGLHGKSFIPLLSSFACAIPGIMAARTIENRKDRLATILVAPFMSCSARLPVYALLIGTFFAAYGAITQAGIMLACYALGIIAAVITAWVFKRSFLKSGSSAFILELPSYKVPQASQVARQVWVNSSKFLTKAGTTIFCLSVVLWGMSYYPRLSGMDDNSRRDQQLVHNLAATHIAAAKLMSESTSGHPEHRGDETVTLALKNGEQAASIEASTSLSTQEKLDKLWAMTNPDLKEFLTQHADDQVKAEQSRYSVSGRLGHLMEPVIKPLGYDWKMGVGLVGAFAAREVFVSTMGITYAVGETEDGKTADLSAAMQADHYATGKPVWTPLVAVSLLVWFVLAMQCMSTLAITRRETGGWGWPIFMLVYMNGLAYVVSLAVFQIGTRVFHLA